MQFRNEELKTTITVEDAPGDPAASLITVGVDGLGGKIHEAVVVAPSRSDADMEAAMMAGFEIASAKAAMAQEAATPSRH